MGILNYTTTISAGKTAAEMQTALAKHGAESVSIIFREREPAGIAFTINTEFGPRDFQLPANVEGVEATIARQQRSGEIRADRRYQGAEHARKVAWRILKDWLGAQLAIIEAGLSRLDEVMLPYMLTSSGATISEAYRVDAGMRAAIASSDAHQLASPR